MTEEGPLSCRTAVALAAAGFGLLVAAMLAILARYGFPQAFGLGAVLALLLWGTLRWAFCTAPVARGGEDRPEAAAPPAPAAAVPASAPPPAPPAASAAPPQAAIRAAPRPSAGPPPRSPVRAGGIDAAVARTKAPPRVAPATEVLARPRDGRPDDLKRIRGIGPALERLLNSEGIWHFDQIAGWKARDIAYVDSRIRGFRGRITRDRWVAQARALAAEEKDGQDAAP